MWQMASDQFNAAFGMVGEQHELRSSPSAVHEQEAFNRESRGHALSDASTFDAGDVGDADERSACVLAGSIRQGQDVCAALKLYDEGMAHYHSGSYALAAEELLEALSLSRTLGLRHREAVVLRELGRCGRVHEQSDVHEAQVLEDVRHVRAL